MFSEIVLSEEAEAKAKAELAKLREFYEATHTGSVPLEKLPETIVEKIAAAERTIADLRQSLVKVQQERDKSRAILEQIHGLRSSADGAAYAYVGCAVLSAIDAALSEGRPA